MFKLYQFITYEPITFHEFYIMILSFTQIELAASSMWSLLDVFNRMVSTGKIPQDSSNVKNSSNFIFFYWSGK